MIQLGARLQAIKTGFDYGGRARATAVFDVGSGRLSTEIDPSQVVELREYMGSRFVITIEPEES